EGGPGAAALGGQVAAPRRRGEGEDVVVHRAGRGLAGRLHLTQVERRVGEAATGGERGGERRARRRERRRRQRRRARGLPHPAHVERSLGGAPQRLDHPHRLAGQRRGGVGQQLGLGGHRLGLPWLLRLLVLVLGRTRYPLTLA